MKLKRQIREQALADVKAMREADIALEAELAEPEPDLAKRTKRDREVTERRSLPDIEEHSFHFVHALVARLADRIEALEAEVAALKKR